MTAEVDSSRVEQRQNTRQTRIRRAAIGTAVAQAFGVIGIVLSLIAVPLFLRWLGQERYGLLLTGLAYAGLLMFADGGLSWSSMLLISHARGRGDNEEVACIVRASIVLAAVSASIVIIVVGCLYLLIRSSHHLAIFPSHPEFPGLLLAIGGSTVITLGFSVFYNVFIGLQEQYLASFYQGVARVCATVASLVVASMGVSVGWVFTANVACVGICGTVAMLHCFKRHHWVFTAGRWWHPAQYRKQVRTGAKSFAMQIGLVLTGAAPVLGIARISGAAIVPSFSVPLTLLNTPLGPIRGFNATLQVAYGDAMGANDAPWIAEIVRTIVRQTLTLFCLLAAGFIALADPFVDLWTAGRIQVSNAMLLSVIGISGCLALNSIFRFALSGMNQHRLAGISELGFGILSFVFVWPVVSLWGHEYVGAGVVGAYLCTSGWLLPLHLMRQLEMNSIFPDFPHLVKLAVATTAAAIAGKAVLQLQVGSAVVLIVLAGISVVFCFGLTGRLLLAKDFQQIAAFFRSKRPFGKRHGGTR